MTEYVIRSRADIEKLVAEVRHLRERVDELEHDRAGLRIDANACWSWAEEFADALRIIAAGGERKAGELADFARGVLAGGGVERDRVGASAAAPESLKPWGSKKARAAVSDFLSANPVVDAVLERSKLYINKWFPGAPVSVYVQSANECGERTLVAKIVSRYDAAETRSRLDGFDDEWWLAVAPLVAGKLVIDVGYTEVIES